MTVHCEIKLIKRSLGELKKLTNLIEGAALNFLDDGYAQLFQQHAGNILSLLQPYGEANEVKSLREEYNRVLRKAQVFDQLPKPLSTSTSDKNEDENKEYFNVQFLVMQSIDEFRYHSADLVSTIEKGELKAKKPAETEQDTTPAKRGMFKRITVWIFKKTWHLIVAIIVAIIGSFIAAILIRYFW